MTDSMLQNHQRVKIFKKKLTSLLARDHLDLNLEVKGDKMKQFRIK